MRRKRSPISPGTSEHTRSGEKPFECPHCPFKAARKGGLTSHIRTHSGEKPFPCLHCPYKAADKANLNRHVRTHSGEKPFQCPHCPYTAAQKGHLNDHLRTHTGEKPFEWPHCMFNAAPLGGEPVLRRHNNSQTNTTEMVHEFKLVVKSNLIKQALPGRNMRSRSSDNRPQLRLQLKVGSLVGFDQCTTARRRESVLTTQLLPLDQGQL
jgi:uncharacterized Zn-finger protein